MKTLILALPLLIFTACATTSESTLTPSTSNTVQKDVYPVESTLQKFLDMQANLSASFPAPLQKFSQVKMVMEINNKPAGKKEVDGKQVFYSTSKITQVGRTKVGEDYYTTNPFRYLGGYMDGGVYVVSNHADLPKTAIVGSEGKFHDLTVYENEEKKKVVFEGEVNWTLDKVSKNNARVCLIYENIKDKTCQIINQEGDVQYVEYHDSLPIIDIDAGVTKLIYTPIVYTNK